MRVYRALWRLIKDKKTYQKGTREQGFFFKLLSKYQLTYDLTNQDIEWFKEEWQVLTFNDFADMNRERHLQLLNHRLFTKAIYQGEVEYPKNFANGYSLPPRTPEVEGITPITIPAFSDVPNGGGTIARSPSTLKSCANEHCNNIAFAINGKCGDCRAEEKEHQTQELNRLNDALGIPKKKTPLWEYEGPVTGDL